MPSFRFRSQAVSLSAAVLAASLFTVLPAKNSLAAPAEIRIDAQVTSDGNGKGFEADVAGNSVEVSSNADVRAGDRVVLTGNYITRGRFNASNVQLIGIAGPDDEPESDTGDDADNRVDFPATVLRQLSNRQIEVRGDNGHIYKVDTLEDTAGLPAGKQIRVQGFAAGLDVKEAGILVATGSPSTGSQFQEPVDVDFPARFTGIDKKRDRAIVRGDDGKEYRLRGDEVEDFNVGDRVRIQGVSRYGVVELRTVESIR